MVRKSYGKMRGTRKKLSSRGRTAVTAYIASFRPGDRVHVSLVPSSPLQHPRFQGKTGEILEKRGCGYAVRVADGNAQKTIFLRPEHMKLQKKGAAENAA